MAALAALGTCLASRIARGEPSPVPAPLLKWSFAFLAVAAASCLSSILRGETLFLLLRGGADPLFVNTLWMSAASRTREAVCVFLSLVALLAALDGFARLADDIALRRRLLGAAAAGAAVAFTFAALERFLPPDERFHPWADIGRKAGSFTDPNALGVGLALLVPLLVAALFSLTGIGRVLAVTALVFSPFALEASGSRTGLLLLAASAVVGAAGLLRSRALPVLPAALGALVLAGLFAAAWAFAPRGGPTASGGLIRRLGSVFSAASFEDLSSHRTFFWRTAFEMMEDEPLSGCGLAGFSYEFPARFEKRHSPITVTDNATNALLDIGAECGIPALLLALAAVVPLLVRAFDAALAKGGVDAAGRAGGAALVGLAVALQTGSHTRFVDVALIAALAGAFVVVPRAPEREAEAAPSEPRRVRPVLAFFGVLASLVAVLPTLKPDAAFRNGPWEGLYGWETFADGSGHRWMGPRAFRRVRKGETRLTLTLANARPDTRPVLVRADVDGAREQQLSVPAGETRDVVIDSIPEGARTVRLRFTPDFVPFEMTGRPDYRRLSVILVFASEPGIS
jgi:O-antigen ligase